MVCMCMCVVQIAHHAQRNIFVIVIVVSTKTSRGDTFAQIKQKKWNKSTISPRHFFPATMVR